ncbi:MAG: glycine C-acetyltransferase, partial [Acidobacteria bacterium]|nr:glycine C-acetyltransferase [Acidobacteriota bacterium]
MNAGYLAHLQRELDQLKAAGLYKTERTITSPQQPRMTANGRDVVCLCANNYLGLANHPEVIAAAKGVMDDHGFGMA